eukprot:TRINITY_DN73327_c0_g1_i1.p1 TRINITY_DN73327_c0_g1~~TRINITY_DN73327_c0_g1_i1.p1  ORF type:complete len:574 (-),score=120.47 TRINITY_DN73327_c0_g1_i1:44-1765(-)
MPAHFCGSGSQVEVQSYRLDPPANAVKMPAGGASLSTAAAAAATRYYEQPEAAARVGPRPGVSNRQHAGSPPLSPSSRQQGLPRARRRRTGRYQHGEGGASRGHGRAAAVAQSASEEAEMAAMRPGSSPADVSPPRSQAQPQHLTGELPVVPPRSSAAPAPAHAAGAVRACGGTSRSAMGRLEELATLDVHECGLQNVLDRVRGHILALAMDARGCHLVQSLLMLSDDRERGNIVWELRGSLLAVLESPHANHVLQRAVELMKPPALDFVLPELLSQRHPAELARHHYGCRVLERLLEHFPASLLVECIEGILQDAPNLARHAFGTYVLQHLLEHGEPAQRRRILVEVLHGDITGTVNNMHAIGVLDKAMTYLAPEDQLSLAEFVMDTPGLLVQMAYQRGGQDPLQRLLQVVRGTPLQEKAIAQLNSSLNGLPDAKQKRALKAALLPDAPSAPVAPPASAPLLAAVADAAGGGDGDSPKNGAGGTGHVPTSPLATSPLATSPLSSAPLPPPPPPPMAAPRLPADAANAAVAGAAGRGGPPPPPTVPPRTVPVAPRPGRDPSPRGQLARRQPPR